MNETNLFLWGVFCFLAVIVIGSMFQYLNVHFRENFGSDCLDFFPIKPVKNVLTKHGTIFVSIASYRDPECVKTVKSIFDNADKPHNIFLGICEQNKELSEGCVTPEIRQKYGRQIRLMTLSHHQAKGPTYARYYCSDLWNGEEYYLQIDSHTTFVKHWDTDLINMIRSIKNDPNESNYPVLSYFPPTQTQMNIQGFPEMDNAKISQGGLPILLCGWSEPHERPRRANKPWTAAGFMFLESSFLKEVPFDPNLSHLFQGEEVLFSARLFTHGYDFYVPNKKVAYHHYNRTGPMFYKDNIDGAECRKQAEARVKFLLKLNDRSDVTNDFLHNHHYYGLGKFRTIDDFFNSSGAVRSNDNKIKSVERWNDKHPPSEKFDGWWFRRDGYQKIHKRT